MELDTENGVEKAATLLLALGPESAAEILKVLGPKEVQRLGHAMASLKTVPQTAIEQVLDEFLGYLETHSSLHVDTNDFIRSAFNQALGEDKASNLINRILQSSETTGIESLKWMDAQTVSDLIRNEHPQIIATILVHLEHDHVSEILNHFSERLRNDVILRIATLDGVQPIALKELNESMLRLLSGPANTKRTALGGVKTVADILNTIGSTTEASVMDALREYDPDLAQQVLDEMFVFENLMDIDDRSIQMILREVQSDSLILALKGASPELREKIFKNMSQRASEMLREDLEARGPVRLSEVEAEQKEILKTVRRLADEGQIILGSKGGEQMV